jgi:hypothetical protein
MDPTHGYYPPLRLRGKWDDIGDLFAVAIHDFLFIEFGHFPYALILRKSVRLPVPVKRPMVDLLATLSRFRDLEKVLID